MAMPTGQALAELCIFLDVTPQDKCITFPGGTTVCVHMPGIPRDGGELVRQLLAEANAALAPLQPIFNIIDAVVAVFKCIQALPEVITNLDPTGVIDCIPDLAKKIQALLALLPQLSLPLLLVALIDLIIEALRGIRNDLLAIALQQQRILEAGLAAVEPGNVALRTIVDCATLDADWMIESANAGAEPLNRLIGVINLLMEMIGLDPLPAVGEISDPEDSVAELDALIEILTSIRDAIPVE